MSHRSRSCILAVAGVFAWVGTFAACAAAPSASTLNVAPVRYTQRQLPNGLQVIAVEDHASPTVAIQVWYHVGGMDDPPGRSGFAHLFEHLMFKSTRYLKSEQFDTLTADVGGENNAFTSDDVTAYHEVVPSNHLETLLWAEAERMSNLEVTDDAFKSERAVVEEEYRQRVLASPYGRFYNAISTSAYQVHPYRRSPIGSIEDLEAATLSDVVAFHATWYRPDDATLIVTGDFDAAQMQRWVDRYFGALPKPATPLPRVSTDEPAWTSDRTIAIEGPKVPLPAVALSWLGPTVADPDGAALRVAAALLAVGDSSRLHQSLVYRQRIASDVGFEADLRVGPGLLTAYAIAAGDEPLPALKAALLNEVERLGRQPATPAELAKVKTQLLTQAIVARQTPLGLGRELAEASVLEGDTERVNRDIAELQAVTAADVQRVMRRYVIGRHYVTLDYTQQGSTR